MAGQDAQKLDGRQVCEALGDWELPRLDLWAVLPGGRQAGPKARAFIAFVEQQLAKTRYGLGVAAEGDTGA
jgi:DNA-binding transcriptional LysR family regulator